MRIGEIIESTSVQFVSESLELGQPPALGSLLKVGVSRESDLYGVVCYGETRSLDPGRPAVRRSTDEVYDDRVYHENPQLQHVLRTEFTCLTVGAMEGGVVSQGLPSQPPPLHFSVRAFYTRFLRSPLNSRVNTPTRSLCFFRISCQISPFSVL